MAIGVRDSTFSTNAVITVGREVRGVPDGRRGAPAAGSLEEKVCTESRRRNIELAASPGFWVRHCQCGCGVCCWENCLAQKAHRTEARAQMSTASCPANRGRAVIAAFV